MMDRKQIELGLIIGGVIVAFFVLVTVTNREAMTTQEAAEADRTRIQRPDAEAIAAIEASVAAEQAAEAEAMDLVECATNPACVRAMLAREPSTEEEAASDLAATVRDQILATSYEEMERLAEQCGTDPACNSIRIRASAGVSDAQRECFVSLPCSAARSVNIDRLSR